jgi:hypothetical protein
LSLNAKDVFKFGDYKFDDFPLDTGVCHGADGKLPAEDVRAAWDAYGPTFLATHGREDDYTGRQVWALTELGEPGHAR